MSNILEKAELWAQLHIALIKKKNGENMDYTIEQLTEALKK